MKRHLKQYVNRRTVNAMVGYLVSMTVTGVSSLVCQSLLDNFYVSIRKSTEHIFQNHNDN